MVRDHARIRTAALVCMACVVEGADMALLPAVYYAISRALSVSPTQLGTITLCRALLQALSSPLSGLCGARFDRTAVIASGIWLWAASTACIAFSRTFASVCVFAGATGVGLALVIPCAQSLIADYFPSEQRGRAFGAMNLVMSAGSMLGGLFATNLAALSPFGFPGWRVAFFATSAVSVAVACAVWAGAVDPTLAKRAHRSGDQRPRLSDVWSDVRGVLARRTFLLIIAQGVVGTMPWNAFAFLTLWLQMLGFSDRSASVLAACFTASTACGAYLGGWLGDWSARRLPDSGRIYTAQVSALSGLPLCVLLVRGLPGEHVERHLWMYIATIAAFGLCISWCQTACNSPLFADITPEKQRALIYAFDRCFEGALAACAAPLVGLIAQGVFGFRVPEPEEQLSRADDASNSRALGNSLLLCCTVPWALCALCYTGLHWTYKRDRIHAKRMDDVDCGIPVAVQDDAKGR